MIPALVPVPGAPWDVLPPGAHPATLAEVAATFAINAKRRLLYKGLLLAAKALRTAGCGKLYLDGSYVTAKTAPGDYDGCWDPTGMDRAKLNPVVLDFSNKRQAMKNKFGGEFFPSNAPNTPTQTFLDFFQVEKFTGQSKGILLIVLTADPALLGRAR
ncbi:MAG: hypothetical protein WAK55_07170 [Xanthobacteraceae bacterium]